MGNPSLSATPYPRRSAAVVAATIAVMVVFAAALTATRPTARGSAPGNPVLVSTMTPLADGGTFSFPDGITLTVAPGWTIDCMGLTWVCAGKSGSSALIEFSSGTPHATDIVDDAAAGVNMTINVNGLTNVMQEPQGGITTVQGKNFTQLLQINYTANRQTNQGTREQYGVWIDLFNPSTQIAGFINLGAANANDVQTAVSDANRMIASIL